jgi:hypothetical protein
LFQLCIPNSFFPFFVNQMMLIEAIFLAIKIYFLGGKNQVAIFIQHFLVADKINAASSPLFLARNIEI